jgi:hypothetical protein
MRWDMRGTYVLLGGTAGALTGTPGGPGRARVAIVLCEIGAQCRSGDAAPRNLSCGTEDQCSAVAACETSAPFPMLSFLNGTLSEGRGGTEVRALLK